MKEYALGGSYDLGVVKLFATYQNNKADCLPLVRPTTPPRLLVQRSGSGWSWRSGIQLRQEQDVRH